MSPGQNTDLTLDRTNLIEETPVNPMPLFDGKVADDAPFKGLEDVIDLTAAICLVLSKGCQNIRLDL